MATGIAVVTAATKRGLPTTPNTADNELLLPVESEMRALAYGKRPLD
jgi:hypothetical protein